MLTNLVGNAIKFTAEGEVRVEVRGQAEGDRHLVRISVSDTGIGMSDEQMGQVFERFSQADASTTRRFGGTGLGLAIARELTRNMGGNIEVESALGEGSRFTATLRLAAAEEADADEAAAPVSGQFVGTRVLLAEDNRVNQLVACGMLERLGCEVVVAEDGGEALDRLAGDRFDVVLMDCMMPVMDGLEATQRFRQSEPDGYRTPVIALTANAMRGDRERCLAAGMDDYLAKPLTRESLEAALARWSHATVIEERAAVSPNPT